jgi:hypothetical protein
MFHIRLPSAPDDFALLAPLDPNKELGDYRCNDADIQFFFCKNCGVRCFLFIGDGEVGIRKDIPGHEGEDVSVWMPKRETWFEYKRSDEGKRRTYLSVNALTLDAGQEGLDLRQWAEEKRISYLDALKFEGSDRFDKPHDGGTY